MSRGDIGGERRGSVGERRVKIGKEARKGIFGAVRRETIVETERGIIGGETRGRIPGQTYSLRCQRPAGFHHRVPQCPQDTKAVRS